MVVFVYVCSPYGGLEENAKRAHAYGQAIAKEGYVPVIPHKMWHGIFNDAVPEQRKLALAAGIELLKKCDQLRVFGDDITPGMAQEINFARANGIPVVKARNVDDNDLGDLFRFFENNFMFINRTIVEVLTDYLEQGLTPDLIKEAIKLTAKKNAGVNYMEAILSCWVSKKIFTVDMLISLKNKKPENKQSSFAAYDKKLIYKLLEDD